MPTKQQTQSELNKALLSAAGHGETDKVKDLISIGADINANDKDGNTPLILAVYVGRTKTAELLINHGANINIRNKCGETPLLWAISRGSIELVQLLLNHCSDVHARNDDGKTAEEFAKEYGYTKIANIIKTEVERTKIPNDVDEHLVHQQKNHNVLQRKDPLTMTNKEFLDSLEAEITNGK